MPWKRRSGEAPDLWEARRRRDQWAQTHPRQARRAARAAGATVLTIALGIILLVYWMITQ